MGRIYARYHAQNWATGRTVQEIRAEVDFLATRYLKPDAFPWNSVGCAEDDYVRMATLNKILAERTGRKTD